MRRAAKASRYCAGRLWLVFAVPFSCAITHPGSNYEFRLAPISDALQTQLNGWVDSAFQPVNHGCHCRAGKFAHPQGAGVLPPLNFNASARKKWRPGPPAPLPEQPYSVQAKAGCSVDSAGWLPGTGFHLKFLHCERERLLWSSRQSPASAGDEGSPRSDCSDGEKKKSLRLDPSAAPQHEG